MASAKPARVRRGAADADSPLYMSSLAKCFQVLEALNTAGRAVGLTELAQLSGLDRSGVQRITHTLRVLGYLRQDPASKAFLAARFKKPLPIILGILAATVINHGLAGALGAWITSTISPEVLRWVLGASFIGMAIWTMIPDKIEEEETQIARRYGVFGATLITFFLAEMGDKTQIATVAMAAHFAEPIWVVLGTTLGMLIADVPAVLVGDRLSNRIPLKLVHSLAAAVFALLGVATLLGAGASLGL